MLAEEDAIEAGALRARPQIEIGVEMTLRHGGIELLRQLSGRYKKLKTQDLIIQRSPNVRERKTSLLLRRSPLSFESMGRTLTCLSLPWRFRNGVSGSAMKRSQYTAAAS